MNLYKMVWYGKKKAFACSVLLVFGVFMLPYGSVYYVSPTGSNPATGGGTFSSPFLTIQKAADVMQAGDTCYVRAGTYREFVQPPRGGTSEALRIVYKAYPGEIPSIRGSEQIATWTQHSGNTWRVDLPDSYFGTFNPFATTVSGDFLDVGKSYHLGQVYFNSESYKEKLGLTEVTSTAKSWYAIRSGTTTTIYANFGGAIPNSGIAEINKREMIIYPGVKGLKYITIDGFEIKHAAPNWNYNLKQQKAAIGVRWGTYWIIQNCKISESKTTGITCGQPDGFTGDRATDINLCGHHSIRNNIIEQCGESGICANGGGLSASVIEGNLIQDINPKKEFGGQESAGIKCHWANDLIIRNNIIRRVYRAIPDNNNLRYPGIWLDWAAQGCRISGNIINVTDDFPINPEMDHGPILIDNNLIMGYTVVTDSDRLIFVHNLFFKSTMEYTQWVEWRQSEYYPPHTFPVATGVSYKPAIAHDRYYNNIYIQAEKDYGAYPNFSEITTWNAQEGPLTYSDMISNYNAYYEGAPKAEWEGANCVVDNVFKSNLAVQDFAAGIKVDFSMNSAAVNLQCPFISYDFIGVFPTVNMGIEDHNGQHISVDRDILGNIRDAVHPTVGPLENLNVGANSIAMTVGPYTSRPTAIVQPAQMHSDRSSRVSGTVSVFDMTGRLVCRNLDLDDMAKVTPRGPTSLSKGIYIIRNDKRFVKKIMIKK